MHRKTPFCDILTKEYPNTNIKIIVDHRFNPFTASLNSAQLFNNFTHLLLITYTLTYYYIATIPLTLITFIILLYLDSSYGN